MSRVGIKTATLSGWTAMALLPVGCGTVGPNNPAITVSPREVRDDLERMRNDPIDLERPVLVLSGYRSPATNANRLTRRIRELTSDHRDDFHTVVYFFGDDIHEIADRVVNEVQQRWPSEDPNKTIEVDVLGISMGGLVARHAALDPGLRPDREDGQRGDATRRLKIRRLITFGTPHQGAKLANRIAIDPAARAMKPGSVYLGQLNATWDDVEYELVPYTYLNDTWVGATRTAPPGEVPIWDRGKRVFSHFVVPGHPLFIADTARRLRGEEPLLAPDSPPPMD